MSRNICKLLGLIMVMAACNSSHEDKEITDTVSTEVGYERQRLALTGNDFKVPVPQGYDWEITQSWEKHCNYCNSKGYDKINNGYYGDYCQLSHATADPKDYGCFDYCKFGWDFNLSGTDDVGKSVLASGDGVVLLAKFGKDANGKYKGGGWGNTVVIDHGNNICSRYSHMKDGSVTVSENQEVCQGLKIGEVGDTPSVGAHLHFQFESCDTRQPLEMGFTDGNEVPKCVMGSDIYTNGVYTALKLTNVEKQACSEEDLLQKDLNPDPEEPQVCELQCPMSKKCEQNGDVPFGDLDDSETASSVGYLWHECAVGGKSDGNFHPYDTLTRAEALKIALVLFGLDKGCEGNLEPFTDVSPVDWFYGYVVCGVKYGIIKTDFGGFNPNQEVYFAEAAKMAVESAVKANKAEIKTGMYVKFPKAGVSNWSYKYLQTIAYYNGIDENMLQKDPYDLVLRGEYARMVASLSPCYCSKNKCKGGCECDQSSKICQTLTVTKDNDTPDSGSYSGYTGEQDAGSFSLSTDAKDIDACTPNCSGKECGTDGCGGSCGNCPSDKSCINPSTGKCVDSCLLTGCSQMGYECGPVKITLNGACYGKIFACGNCEEGKACNSGKCQPICIPKCAGKECGDDGCGSLCGICPGDKFCNSNSKCQNLCTPKCEGKVCGADTCGGSCGTCPYGEGCSNGKCDKACVQSEFCAANGYECGSWLSVKPGTCQGSTLNCGSCTPGKTCSGDGKCSTTKPLDSGQSWKCDPLKGYTIYLYSPTDGKWESITSPSQKYFSGTFVGGMSLHYNCSELPATLLISKITSSGNVWLTDISLPPFAMKWPFEGSIVFPFPSSQGDVVATGFSLKAGYNTLLKIPYN
jgi:hypothetical protein